MMDVRAAKKLSETAKNDDNMENFAIFITDRMAISMRYIDKTSLNNEYEYFAICVSLSQDALKWAKKSHNNNNIN